LACELAERAHNHFKTVHKLLWIWFWLSFVGMR